MKSINEIKEQMEWYKTYANRQSKLYADGRISKREYNIRIKEVKIRMKELVWVLGEDN